MRFRWLLNFIELVFMVLNSELRPARPWDLHGQSSGRSFGFVASVSFKNGVYGERTR